MLLICQRYNFESNSQRNKREVSLDRSCYWYVKDTILKAIHNSSSVSIGKLLVVTDMSKIQFWKQFTTTRTIENRSELLLLICQRYNFESNSQLIYIVLNSLPVVTDMSKIQRTCVKMAEWGQNMISGWYLYHFCVIPPYF